MPSLRSIVNSGHALGWTVMMCSAGVATYGVTGDRALFRRMTRFWAEGLARGWGMRVDAHGVDNISPSETYVFIANHQSYVDIVALFVAVPINVGFLAKKELRRVPFLGQAMVAGGHVFVDRNRHTSAVKAMQAAAEDVKQGASLVIFPEGTRASKDEIQPFKKGGFHLARAADVAVVPVGLRGTRALMGRDALTISPGTVEVHIGKPVRPSDFADINAFSDHVRVQVGLLAAMPLSSRGGSSEQTEADEPQVPTQADTPSRVR